ncbi:MAG: PD40 domain-containing protein [Bacteroidetes bacterium]|nr:PD40 domain-containing protein [Bacteroidota bacterium]MBL6943784.1 PD40 domain-containing protein [Bacteroidales bacterium]
MKKLLFALVLLISINMVSQEDTRLLRFPAVHGQKVVFTYAGDLYQVPLSGGTARKLTSDVNGYEMFAHFSPDGKNIAFTGQYDGNTEVFIIPSKGGIPKRLTYTATLGRDDISDRMGPNNIVMAWRNNNEIVYRSRKQTFNSFKGQLFQVNKNGGLSEELPLPTGGWCSFSDDGKKIAYNRVFREFRTWKYYKGGMADDVWVYDFETKETINITNNDNQNIFPMWHGDKVYFLSDRDRTMNLFEYDLITQTTTKITNYNDFDIKFPSLGNESIIFENGGWNYNYNFADKNITKITVNINNDFTTGRDELKDASKFINSWAVSPDGKRIVFGARGDVYTVPVKSGITRNLTHSSGVHDRNVEWSPKGKYISFISDRTGEDEIYIQNQNGLEEAIQLTLNSDTYKYNPIWSPDGKNLLWSDKMGRLVYINIDTKKIIKVDESKAWEIRDYTWSPDSRWIAYTLHQSFTVNRIFIFDTKSGESKPVTDNWYNSGQPAFDSNGKFLFFTSARDFNPIYSRTEWNHAYRDMSKIYFVTLLKSTPSPFEPENDEVEVAKAVVTDNKDKNDNKNKDSVKDDELSVKIDFDGIINRIIELPVKAANYWNITAVDNNIYYIMNSSGERETQLKMFDLKKQKETELSTIISYIVSANHKKMFVNIDGKYAIIDLPNSKIKPDDFIDLTNMKAMVNMKEEWTQIYNESWRQMRDFFYAPNMHGVDWPSIQKKYEVLLPYVNNRNDLNYVIGEMVGELSVGHAYVLGGDKPEPARIKTGLLGAKISKDKSGYFAINDILMGENWTKGARSPLTEVGVDVSEGDYIIAVNGTSVKDVDDIYSMLIGTAGQQVLLTVNSKPDTEGARDVIVMPTDDESGLYYYTWVMGNTEKVNKATDGKVGYIHIPDMGAGGLNEFVKHFYPQLNKSALIIDDRGNGGGNVSPMIIERLNRELALYGMSRNNSVNTKPREMMRGPKVLLLDSYSASDGDLFPYQFKKLEMGTLIGTRSWGGVVGIRGSMPFIDGGDLRRPEFAPFDENGEWVIEGYGVDPDIVIDNDPAKEYAGEDEQLNKAIEVILEQLKDYKPLPEIPDYPDKSK